MSPRRTRRARRGRLPVPRLPIERYELACGARLLVSPRPGAPVLALQLHVRGGHAWDPSGKGGVANLAGALLDQGTADFSEEEIAGLLEPRSGSLSGESNGVAGAIAAADWKLLLELFASMVVRPTYPRDRVELQRKRLLDRLAIEREDPRVRGGQMFRELVYGQHWLGRPACGTVDSVERISRADLVRHHRRYWCGRRAIIAISGDVDGLAVRRALERLLARWTPGTSDDAPSAPLPPIAPRASAFRADRQQVHVYLGHLGIDRNDPDYPALTVMDHVLGTGPGFTNRLARILRDERGLCYSVHASIHQSAGVHPGTFTAYIGTSPERVRTAVRTFLAEMQRIRREDVTAEELELAKSYLAGSYALAFERAARRAGWLVLAERMGFPEDHLERLLEKIDAVTAEDVRRAAAAHLHPHAPTLVGAGPIERADLEAMLGARARRAASARPAPGRRKAARAAGTREGGARAASARAEPAATRPA